MSEEYTQSKAYLDAMSRFGKQESPYSPVKHYFLGQLEQAKGEADKLAKIAGEANTARYAAIQERDAARESHEYMTSRYQLACKQIKHAETERDEAKAESAKHEAMLKAAQQLLISRGNELLAARRDLATTRNSNSASRDELAQLQDRKPVKSLEARIEAIEALLKAR